MSMVERGPKVIPGFEIVGMKVKKGREILVTIDLNTKDPSLVVSAPRNLSAELAGMLSCEEWNKKRGEAIIEGRFNFKTDDITTILDESGEIQPYTKPVGGVFVKRATPVPGKHRNSLTRMPERHANNYPVVTGDNQLQNSHKVRFSGGNYHIWEVSRGGKIRPVIPSSILKAPVITIEDLEPEDRSTKPARNPYTHIIIPHTNGVSPSRFKVQEIAKFTVERR